MTKKGEESDVMTHSEALVFVSNNRTRNALKGFSEGRLASRGGYYCRRCNAGPFMDKRELHKHRNGKRFPCPVLDEERRVKAEKEALRKSQLVFSFGENK